MGGLDLGRGTAREGGGVDPPSYQLESECLGAIGTENVLLFFF